MLEADPKYGTYATMMVMSHLSLSRDPAYRRVDVDAKTGKVKGLF